MKTIVLLISLFLFNCDNGKNKMNYGYVLDVIISPFSQSGSTAISYKPFMKTYESVALMKTDQNAENHTKNVSYFSSIYTVLLYNKSLPVKAELKIQKKSILPDKEKIKAMLIVKPVYRADTKLSTGNIKVFLNERVFFINPLEGDVTFEDSFLKKDLDIETITVSFEKEGDFLIGVESVEVLVE